MDEGYGHADVWFMTVNITPQVFNSECLKGSTICQVEGRSVSTTIKRGLAKWKSYRMRQWVLRVSGQAGL